MSRKNEVTSLNYIKECVNYDKNIEFCNCDLTIIKRLLASVKENIDDSLFPDFYIDNGFIEHFIVSSSKENKKGSSFKIYENTFNKNCETFFKKKDQEFLSKEANNTYIDSETCEDIFEDTSYKCFLSSFKKNFDKHIMSLIKNDLKKKVSIFLVVQEGGRLIVNKNSLSAEFYLISKDRNILEYLKTIKKYVNYVIFNACDSIEIIDLSKINNLIKSSAIRNDISGGRMINIKLKTYVNLDKSFFKKKQN